MEQQFSIWLETPCLAIRILNPFPVTNFDPDLEPPLLRDFPLGMNTLVGFSGPDLGCSGKYQRECRRENTSIQPNILDITLATVDVNGIKAMGSLVTTQNSTFISLTSNVISDAATIQLTPIPDSLAFRVS